jgi:hypothetical protein
MHTKASKIENASNGEITSDVVQAMSQIWKEQQKQKIKRDNF